MKLFFLLSLVVFALASHPQDHLDAWTNWKNQNNKVYSSAGEEQARFAIFLETLKRIDDKNSKAQNPVYGLTRFSDLTIEEFKSTYLGYVPNPNQTERPYIPFPKVDAPSSFDWRDQNKVTAVKDQGQCGSCWAFSVTENVESMWMIAKNLDSSSMSPLSPQEIVDCDTSDSGCNGGDPPTAYQYIQSAGGLETDSDYPYTAQDGSCSFDSSKVYATISGFTYATQSQDEGEMMTALSSNGPLSICVDAESWNDYSGGVLMASDCGTSLDHCVMAVGYTSDYWIVRNSWGGSWGESGYIRLQYGQNTCGLAQEATSATI